MQTNSGKRSLESYKIFPYVAWMTIFFFSAFVINLTIKLSHVTDDFDVRITNLEKAVQTPVNQIEDFSI